MMKQLRNQLQLTQQALADRLDVAQPTVASWETKSRKPSVPVALRLIDLCKREGLRIDLETIYSKFH